MITKKQKRQIQGEYQRKNHRKCPENHTKSL